MPESKDDAAMRAASAKELEVAQKEVVVLLQKNLFLQRMMAVVMTVCLAVISIAGIVGARTGAEAKEISQSNNRFLTNFSSFMQCLVVSDKEVVTTLGVDKYFDECNKLLFRGTGQKPEPVTKVTIPPGTEISTTTTTAG